MTSRHTGFVLAYLLVATGCFIGLAFYVHATPQLSADIALSQAVQSFNPLWFDSLMRAVSQLGFDWKALSAISLVTLWLVFRKLRWEALSGVVASTGIWVLDNVVKTLVARPRPTSDIVQVITPLGGPSFTSGHVTSFTVYYGFLIFLCLTLLKPSWKRTALMSLLGLLILLVGISRIYSGEHWPTDVLGSYLLGSLWLLVIIHLYRWSKARIARGRARLEALCSAMQAAITGRGHILLNALIAVYLVLGAMVFAVLTWYFRSVPYFDFDDDLTRAVQAYRTDSLHAAMYWISWIGFSPQAAIVAGLVNLFIFARGYKREAMVGLGAALSIYVVNSMLKELVYRPRPTLEQVYHILFPLDDSSFPSGHVSSLVVMGGFVIFLLCTYYQTRFLRNLLVALVACLILLMGLARVYSGEHWTSDVGSSALLGSLGLVLTIFIYRRQRPSRTSASLETG